MQPAIEFRDVSFTTPQRRVLLDGISLAIEESTTMAILGRSGSGKTTLLKTVNRMIEPTSGDVLVNGRSVREVDLIHLRRGIGYVIQETGLFPHLTVERNAAMVPEISGMPRDACRRENALPPREAPMAGKAPEAWPNTAGTGAWLGGRNRQSLIRIAVRTGPRKYRRWFPFDAEVCRKQVPERNSGPW